MSPPPAPAEDLVSSSGAGVKVQRTKIKALEKPRGSADLVVLTEEEVLQINEKRCPSSVFQNGNWGIIDAYNDCVDAIDALIHAFILLIEICDGRLEFLDLIYERWTDFDFIRFISLLFEILRFPTFISFHY